MLPARAEKGGVASGGGASTSAGSAGNLPATPGRAQLYDAELTLKIKDLSTATKQALRLTRDFHGYVRSVDYGSGTERGSAYLVLRVPVGSVQEAIVKFSALGRILDQHVSIQDVQPTVDKRFRQMQAQRDQITKLQAKLQDQSLTTAQRAALADELVATQQRSSPCRSRRRRWPGRRASQRSSSTCARARRPSSSPTIRAGSARRSTAPARSWSTRRRCWCTCWSSARRC